MNIEVKLFFNLTKFLPAGTKKNTATMCVENELSVQGLVGKLGLPSDITKIVLVNGIKAHGDTKLRENDSVAIFPPMAGG